MSHQNTWSIALAKRHFRIDQWGKSYFDINAQGNVTAKAASSEMDLYILSNKLRQQGIRLPVLVRFPQLLQQSLDDLCIAFEEAMKSHHYAEKYVAAYPVKVNQQAAVIHHFQSQSKWPLAFEVGSKAELIACLGMIETTRTIICNGYKDENYIRLALLGQLLAHNVVIVLENLTELHHVLKQSALLKVQPTLGMRVRLSAIAKGKWQNTGGAYAKFGLTASEVVSLVDRLKEKNAQSWMKMLHFHMGSQISNLQDIHAGLQEGMHYFSQLHEAGVALEMLNVGGGLAVDYEGAHSDSYFSMNYSAQDYANLVIKAVQENCRRCSIRVPTIFSENGRAMTAYHAVLLTNVIDVEDTQRGTAQAPDTLDASAAHNAEVIEFIRLAEAIDSEIAACPTICNVREFFLQCKTIAENIQQAFSHGELGLHEKAMAERLMHDVYQTIINVPNDLYERELAELNDMLTAKYFCNFSLFQSTPDIWGLKQILPIMPLHRLNEKPTIRSRIYDLTCDSDGRIDHYIENGSIRSHLSLHPFQEGEDSMLGIFLVGAYQEVLGDVHNLFGDTNVVNVIMNTNGSYRLHDQEPGDTIAEILSCLHIDTMSMRQLWLQRLSKNNVLDPVRKHVLDELEASLKMDSYFDQPLKKTLSGR